MADLGKGHPTRGVIIPVLGASAVHQSGAHVTGKSPSMRLTFQKGSTRLRISVTSFRLSCGDN